MATKTRTAVRYRRKREGRTNYRKRLELLKGRKIRFVVRKTSTQAVLQLVKYEPDGDKVLVTVRSSELKKHGWNYNFKNIPASYLAGALLAKKAKEHKINEAILDLGLQTPKSGSKLFAVLKGAIDGGLNIPASKSVFPPEERLTGKHISSYLDKFKNMSADFDKLKQELTK